MISGQGIDMAVRVTLAPGRGGIARVIRYDLRGEQGSIYLRRFTGHPSTGWWLWGGDAPRVIQVTAAQRTEIANLTRALMGAAGSVGGSEEVCPAGEQAFIEASFEGRATSFSRPCVGNADPGGRLSQLLSQIAGSRTEEELASAAVAELMEADRVFAAKAAADGVPAAFNEYAAEDAIMVTSDSVANGRAGVATRFQTWPEGARLEWTPQTARVSARGDMGWTWGNSTYIAPDGARETGRYVSIWTRDYEGNWRFAFDAPIR